MRRPIDQAGRSSSARAGIRQLARSSRETRGGGGAPREVNQLQTMPASKPAAATEPRITSSAGTSTDGIAVEMTRIADRTSIAPTIKPATAFSHGRLTQGPRTAGSLHSNTAKTVVLEIGRAHV